MTELGSRLRSAREEKNLTLDELQEITRIQKKYLIAIEEGNYSMLPGKFYARAFIKQYSEAVGLHAEELFQEHKHEIPLAYEDDLPEQLSRVQSRGAVSPRSTKLMEMLPKIIIGASVLAALVLTWYLVLKIIDPKEELIENANNETVGIKESEEVVPPKQAEDTTKDKEIKEAKSKEDTKDKKPAEKTKKQELTMAGVSGVVTTYNLLQAEKFELEVKAAPAGETWVKVNSGGEGTVYQGMLKDGEAQTFDFTAESEVYLVVGNSLNTEVIVNGEKLNYELAPEKYVKQDVKILFAKE